jgi:hypothetical protein
MEKFNTKIPVRYGLIALAFVITVGLMMYVFYQSLISSYLLFGAVVLLSFGVVLFLGIWSGITYRRENDGVISFSHAFLAVFIVFVFNSVGSTSTQLLINKVIDTQYAEKASSMLREKMSERFEKMNMTDDQIKEAMKGMTAENFDPPLIMQLRGFAISLAVFAVISAIVAAFIKRGSNDLISTGTPPTKIPTI